MQIDQMLCTACEECIPYCPVGAIAVVDETVDIDFDACVECGTCIRYAPCPVDAIQESPEALEWPRVLRREYSDPGIRHSTTKGFGQRNGGVKDQRCDRTRQARTTGHGHGVRPTRHIHSVEGTGEDDDGLGSNRDPLRGANPVTFLLADPDAGRMREEVKNERVLSAILEVEFDAAKLPGVIATVEAVAPTLETVFSWCLITRLEDDGSVAVLPALQELGVEVRPNAKVNVGLGRPLVQD